MCLRVRTDLPCPGLLGWDGWREMGRCLGGMAWFWPVPLGYCNLHLQSASRAQRPPPRGSEFGGAVAWWVMPGKVRLSVPGASGRCKKEKKSKGATLARPWPKLVSLCPPATARHGPTVAPPAAGIQPPAHPPFPQIPKSENHPRRFLPACACDRPWPTVPAPVPAWLAFNLDPTSFTSGRASSSLSVSTPFFLLAPILFLSPLASLVSRLSQHVGLRSSLSPSITFPAVLNTTFQIVITISHRPIPRRDSTRPHIVRTSCAHAHKLL